MKRTLTGWREIAEYLNVSVREAQYREKGEGLPIYRNTRVFAYSDELDRWKQGQILSTDRRPLHSQEQTLPVHNPAPPHKPEFLFYVFMTPQNCDALVGDLEERYKLIRKKFGQRRADFWYWTQTALSLGPIVWAWGKKVSMKPVLALIGWALAKGLIGHDGWLAAVVELWKRIRS